MRDSGTACSDAKDHRRFIRDNKEVCHVHMDRSSLQKNCGHSYMDDGITRPACVWCFAPWEDVQKFFERMG